MEAKITKNLLYNPFFVTFVTFVTFVHFVPS